MRGLLCILVGILFYGVETMSAFAAEATLVGDVLPSASLPNGGAGISPSGDGTVGAPYVYTFSTANGLDMAGWKIYGNALINKNTALNMNGGSIIGTQSATAFDFHATQNAGSTYTAHLTITNVGVIKIGKIWTYQEGSSDSYPAAPYGGNVTIGANATGQRAGKVEIAEIITHTYGSHVRIDAGVVTIDSTNDVSIWDGATDGDIDTRTHADRDGSEYAASGNVTIRHQGAFRARDILANEPANYRGTPGNIVLNGDILSTGPLGICQVNKLTAADELNSVEGGHSPGNVTIQGYTGITAADGIYTYRGAVYGSLGAGNITISNVAGNISIGTGGLQSWGGSGHIFITTTGGTITVNGPIDSYGVDRAKDAGNVTLSSAGNIMVGGTINLDRYSDGSQGVLSLSATRVNSLITLSALDLNKMNYAVVSPGSKCIVNGDLIGFSTNVAAQTQLRMPAGKRMLYYPGRINNAYLAEGRYILADASGIPANGGILMPYTPPGTVITLR